MCASGTKSGASTSLNKDLTKNNLRSALLVAGMMPLIMLVVNLSSVGVVWFGGHRIQSGEMRLGALTAFIAYILQILIAIMMAMYVFMTAPRAAACAERIQAVLDTAPAITDGPGGATPEGHAVQFRNVSFAYPGAEAPVLDGVSFTAVPGTVTAVIGATGSGKTTLLNLLPRFLAATGGTISIGGCDVRSLPLDTLRSLIAVVPQHSYLFSGTLAGNLRMAAPAATDEDLWRVLGSAQAEEFVRKLPLGLEAPVSQGGTNFSGGQRQRLCIARALLREAPVYLFDDSFSALDYGTDYRLREAMGPLLRTATVLIVAERVATIVDAGLILVLEDGRLVAQGTHHATDGILAELPGNRRLPAGAGGDPVTPEQALDAGTDAPAARDAKDQPLVDTPSGGRSESLPVLSQEEAPKGSRFRWRTAGRLLGLLRPSKWRMVGVDRRHVRLCGAQRGGAESPG